jgi:hypothetical protein
MTVPDSWTLDALVEAFEQHLRRTRELRDQTQHGYASLVRLMIREALGDDPIDLRRFGASYVLGFVRGVAGRFSPRSMKAVRHGAAVVLPLLRTEGVGDERLDAAITRVPFFRLSTLPRFLSDEQLDKLSTSFASDTPCALRDRAIVLCLPTLRLRPGEAGSARGVPGRAAVGVVLQHGSCAGPTRRRGALRRDVRGMGSTRDRGSFRRPGPRAFTGTRRHLHRDSSCRKQNHATPASGGMTLKTYWRKDSPS